MNYSDPFFQYGQYGSKTLMQTAGLSVTLHMPRALQSRFSGGEEVSQALPPGNPRAAFLVDDYPASPEEWMRSQPGMASFMVPVAAEHGMWLDFNRNAEHEKHVAVVVSTQGVNAITGMKSDTMRLEQYIHKCPVHGVDFTGNRRCSKCGYDWPKQNYLTTTTTPEGLLWLDGFRASDGVTRQWVFTEDVRKSVAAAIIGAERVHAIGVAFFLSKEPRPPRPVYRSRGGPVFGSAGGGFKLCSMGPSDMMLESLESDSAVMTRSVGQPKARYRSVAPVKKLEVAAGAKIDQHIYPDDKPLEFYEEKPAGVIIINYTDVETLNQVLAQGRTGSDEGFLGKAGVPLGH